MAVVRTHVTIPEETLKEFDALVGKRGRSKFISEAVADRLTNARQRRLVAAVTEFARPCPDIRPPEWATSESAAKWVHDLRQFERPD